MQQSHPYEDNDLEIIAHMNPAEVEDLFNVQGKHSFDERTGLPSFLPLLEKISHQNILPHLQKFMEDSYTPSMHTASINEMLSKAGRYGDSVPVKVPKVLADLFDMKLNNGKPSINPTTGKREYFLGGLLSGIKNIFSNGMSSLGNIANSIVPGVGDMMSKATSLIGGPALQGFASAAQNAAQTGNYNLGDFGKSVLTNTVQNAAPMAADLASGGLQAFGDRMGNPEFGAIAGQTASNFINNYVPKAAEAYAQGTQMPDAGRTFATSASEPLASYGGGNNPYATGVSTMLGRYGEGEEPKSAAMQGIDAGLSQVQNPYAKMAGKIGLNAYQNYSSGKPGGQAMVEALNNNAQNFDQFAPTYQ